MNYSRKGAKNAEKTGIKNTKEATQKQFKGEQCPLIFYVS